MLGGLLIMMGHHARSEALFYYFRLQDQIPENHLLRLVDKHAWLRQLTISAPTPVQGSPRATAALRTPSWRLLGWECRGRHPSTG